jgi:hypothetical protein
MGMNLAKITKAKWPFRDSSRRESQEDEAAAAFRKNNCKPCGVLLR